MPHLSESCERHLEAGRRALSLGDVATAETELRAAITHAETGDAGTGLLEAALGTYAQLLYHARRFADAAPVFQRALELRERASDDDAQSLVPSLHNLAAVHLAAGNTDQAEPLLRRALAILEKTHGPEHPELAGILNGLSQLCLKRGAHAEAEPLLKRLLNIRRADGGEERPEVATIMASLATVHHALAEHEAAERLLRRVLEIRERTLAPNHFAIATSLEALAETCATRGKLDEALALLERALDIRERTLGASHGSLGIVRAKIADLQLQLSNDAFAVPLMEPMADLRPTASPPAALRSSEARIARAVAEPLAPAPLTDFRPPVEPRTGTAPATAGDRLAPVRRLAAELHDEPMGAAVAERDTASALSVAYLPTGSALVLPGERGGETPPADASDEELDFEALTMDGQRPASMFAKPATRFAILGIALTLLAGAGALVAKGSGAEDGDGFVDAPSGTRDAQPQASLGGMVALPAPDTLASGVDSAAKPTTTTTDRMSSAAGNRTAEPGTRETRRTVATSAETAAPLVSPAPVFVRGLDRVDIRGTSQAPGLELGTSVAQRELGEALGARGADRSTSAYLSSAPKYVPAAILVKPQPRYPSELRRAGITGEVTMSFTVDTTGRVIAGTIRVMSATDVRFVPSVTEVLPQLRFAPAESAGVKVPQQVSMPFKFQRQAEPEPTPD